MKKVILIIGVCLMVGLFVNGVSKTTKTMNECMQEHSYNYCKGLYE